MALLTEYGLCSGEAAAAAAAFYLRSRRRIGDSYTRARRWRSPEAAVIPNFHLPMRSLEVKNRRTAKVSLNKLSLTSCRTAEVHLTIMHSSSFLDIRWRDLLPFGQTCVATEESLKMKILIWRIPHGRLPTCDGLAPFMKEIMTTCLCGKEYEILDYLFT